MLPLRPALSCSSNGTGANIATTDIAMAKTYEQVQKQIDQLKKEAEKLRSKELEGVIGRIKEAVAAYGLTANDLGLNGAHRPKRGKAVAKAAKHGATKSKSARSVKYRDDAGNTWVGRGPRPQWLRDALASGKELKDFAVGSR
jgi:DNA-binding protein H-NS